ncbi:TPR-like protein [Pleomassaria siparia CBS 279.74]|uniref:TPR-like protein n=1 Tax=Pleomassaria siparia CBS 279.74 TaxID=1314801 RepID=A0A6G1KID4_9PLEO|nr:TPR-like protein [Pleomassaria siparia CBS 279.74]
MAEIAALSLASNIIQVVSFGGAVLARFESFQSKTGDLPESFQHIKNKLPILILRLKQTQEAARDGRISTDEEAALKPMLKGCWKEIKLLEEVIAKAMPKPGESGIRKGFRAVGSLRYDARIEKMAKAIDGYVNYFALSAISTTTTEPRVPPPRGTTCLFPRDPHFVERTVLAEILAKRKPSSRLALVGLGGVGKSQIVNEYAHRIRDQFEETWVFWVYAGSLATFENDYRRIAEMVGAVGWDDKAVNIAKLVHSWLSNEANGNWVMIIDNADDIDVFTATPSNSTEASTGTGLAPDSGTVSQLIDFIPNSRNGSIVITSRNRDVAFHLTCSYPHILSVEPMDEAEAMTLLNSKLVGTHPHDDMIELLNVLDYMPLAISQAAAAISKMLPRVTVASYTEELKKGDAERSKLLEADLREAGRDRGRSNSIVTTWHITFQYVRRTKPSAARLLSLMCLFNRQGIPETLLVGQYEHSLIASYTKPKSKLASWGRLRKHIRRKGNQIGRNNEKEPFNYNFDDDWQILTDFSLIRTHVDGHHFDMHRLVQITTKKWLDIQAELHLWKEKFIILMNESYPCLNNLLPHALAAVPYRPPSGIPLQVWGHLLYKLAEHSMTQSAFNTAGDMYQAAFEAYEATLGVDNPRTLLSAREVAYVLSIQENNSLSETLHRRVLQARQTVLGLDHPDTLSSMEDVGYVLIKQGKFEEGDAIKLQALRIRERVFGSDVKTTQDSMGVISLDLMCHGRYKDAEEMFLRENAARNKTAPLDFDDEWCQSMSGLGFVCQSRGKLKEAELLFRQVLDALEKAFLLGQGSKTQYIETSGLLAKVLQQQQRYAEAEGLYQRALDGYIKYDFKIRETLSMMGQFAEVLEMLGKVEEVKALCRKAAEGWEKIEDDDDDHDTIVPVYFLAGLFYKHEMFEEALPLYQRSLIGSEKLLGSGHEDTTQFINDYQKCEEMLALHNKAISTSNLGEPPVVEEHADSEQKQRKNGKEVEVGVMKAEEEESEEQAVDSRGGKSGTETVSMKIGTEHLNLSRAYINEMHQNAVDRDEEDMVPAITQRIALLA